MTLNLYQKSAISWFPEKISPVFFSLSIYPINLRFSYIVFMSEDMVWLCKADGNNTNWNGSYAPFLYKHSTSELGC